MLYTNTEFFKDLTDCVNLFSDFNLEIKHNQEINDENIIDKVIIGEHEFKYVNLLGKNPNVITYTRKRKKSAKLAVFYSISDITGQKHAFGGLTGIRPTKLFYEYGNNAEKEFLNTYRVRDDKLKLIKNIISNQEKYRNFSDNNVDIYLGIPFCKTRCSYCSFLSAEIDKSKELISDYINTLIVEIKAVKKLIIDKKLNVNCIYIGGGTPTSITAVQLDEILSELTFNVSEFTVEAGRPDTITQDKLEVFKKHNVDRISINPQTFCDETLKIIGRNHDSKQIYDVYKMAKNYGFKINMDLIAGLPNETFEIFSESIKKAVDLDPENITVHTLALKKGAKLKLDNYCASGLEVSKMVDFSIEYLNENLYNPYYMYRQKYVASNLENVGYYKKYPCKYNIDIMEENTSIIAVGANAITKRIFNSENRLERQPNPKDVKTYIEKIDKIIEDKNDLFN